MTVLIYVTENKMQARKIKTKYCESISAMERDSEHCVIDSVNS